MTPAVDVGGATGACMAVAEAVPSVAGEDGRATHEFAIRTMQMAATCVAWILIVTNPDYQRSIKYTRGRISMKRHLPILLCLAAGLFLRLVGLDAVRAYFDFATPLSLALEILEKLSRGDFSALPVLGGGSGARLQNPIAASYLWSVVALFDRDPYSANVISVLLSVFGIALVFDLGRTLFTKSVGLSAAVLVAASPWSIYYARGTWLQGQLEFSSIFCGWVVLRLTHTSNRPGSRPVDNRRRAILVVLGMAGCAVVMQTYLVAVALILSVGAGCAIQIMRDRRLARPILAGCAVCLAGVLIFGGISLSSPGNVTGAIQTGLGTTGYEHDSSTRLDAARFAVGRTMETLDGANFIAQTTATGAGALAAWPQSVASARALVIDAIILVGIGLALALAVVPSRFSQSVRRAPILAILAWFWLPLLGAVALNFSNLLAMAGHYMLLTQPATALLAALPTLWLNQLSKSIRRLLTGGLTILAILSFILSGWLGAVQQQYVLDHPHLNLAVQEVLGWYPLRTQRALAALWRTECREVTPETYGIIISSLMQSSSAVRELTSRVGDWDSNRGSSVWEILPNGGTCASRVGMPPAPWSDIFELAMPDGLPITTFRSRPVNEPELLRSLTNEPVENLSLNLGWTYLGATKLGAARPGEQVTVTQLWRIDSLPTEPYYDWDYSTYVTLRGPSDYHAQLSNHIWLPAPRRWRIADYVLQTTAITLPDGLAHGPYSLEFSLFDEHLGRNAVYFAPSNRTVPIISIKRELTLLQ